MSGSTRVSLRTRTEIIEGHEEREGLRRSPSGGASAFMIASNLVPKILYDSAPRKLSSGACSSSAPSILHKETKLNLTLANISFLSFAGGYGGGYDDRGGYDRDRY